ncbi:PspC domain-containing protein [Corynebacterium belfantii]|uniref:PspC domain-containing protein n=1 Tax=Corynebacterium belfantii TaxID=2014537 RepID=UPI001F327B3A|nr:PspC domain-containing protein [Corynebacterium belfantii]
MAPSRKNKRIAGVCARVAETYEISADTVRIIYVIVGICGLSMIAVYLIQMVHLPKAINNS